MALPKLHRPRKTTSRLSEVTRRSRSSSSSNALSLRRQHHRFLAAPPSFTTIITTTAIACLALATAASSTSAATGATTTRRQGFLIPTAPAAAAKAGGCCRRRGLEEYASRGCFVLCVTSASASSKDHLSGTVRRHRSSRELKHASIVGRTRAGGLASRSLGGSFTRGNGFGRQDQHQMGGRGLGGDVGLWAAKNDAAEDEKLKRKRRSRIRRVFDRMAGRLQPRTSTASASIIYDTQIESERGEEDVAMDLSQIRAGGNTSTFDADARCPTCRPVVPYLKANLVSKLFFSWVTPLLALGNTKFLEEQDLWDLPENQQMHTVADAFEAAYAQESGAGTATVIAKPQGQGDEAGVTTDDSGGGPEVEWRSSGRRKGKHPLVPAVSDIALLRALWTLYKGPFLRAGVIRFLNTCVQFLPAILVQRLLRLLESGIAAGGAEAARQAYLTCLALFSVVTVKTTIENQYFYRLSNLGIAIRGALSTAVYRKSLRLSPSARQNATVGEMVNLMQLDAGRLESLPASLHTVWDSAFQMIGYTVLLFACLGPSVMAGISLLVLLTPLNTFFFQRLSAFRSEILTQTDLRVKLVNEMLQGIRAIKFYNWESPFRERVENIHNAELDIMRRSTTMRSLLSVILTTTPALVIVITLGIYSMLGNPLTPSKVFTALTLFNQIRLPLYFLPVTLSSLADAQVAIDRLSKFFNAAEVAPYVQRVNGGVLLQHPHGEEAGTTGSSSTIKSSSSSGGLGGGRTYPDDVCISMREGAFFWTDPEEESESKVENEVVVQGAEEGEDEDSLLLLRRRGRTTVSPALHGCTLQVNKGELVAVVGAVGSGKSSLLSGLLGDMKHVSGEVYATGSLAYVPQTAWIPNDTVRNNILFGQPFDDEKYRRVLRVCRLERDLQLLENGDMTEIGEQGINLSGGQKQRLSLARALYSDADLFFLDDPLSALDAEIGKQVFEGCIRDALTGKTRILVTNQLQFLPQVDKIVVMGTLPGAEGATIVDQGTYQDLVAKGRDLTNILNDHVRRPSTTSSTLSEAEIGTPIATDGSSDAAAAAGETLDANARKHSINTTQSAHSTVTVSATTAKDEEEHEEVEQQSERHKTTTVTASAPSSHREGVRHAAAAAVRGPEGGGIGELLGGSGGTVPSMIEEGLFSHRVIEEEDCGPLDLSDYGGGGKKPSYEGEDGSGGSGRLITAEERSTGAVPGRVYRDYFAAAGSYGVLAGLVGLFFVSNFSVQLQQWVVSFWTSDPGYTKHSLGFYLAGVAASAGVVGVFSHLRTILFFHLGLRASKRLHGALLRRVLHAPVSFFDTTPVGRIVQRFSKDTDQIDQQLISQISMTINAGLGAIGAGGAIIVATPLFTLGMVPLSWVYLRVMNYFRQVARELKRLDSITRSPIYAHFGETLGGLSAIRAFGHVKLFARANERLVDNNLSSYFALKVVDRWLSVRLELLGNFVVLAATLLSVLAATNGRLIAGLAGLSITNALSMTGLLNWGVRCFTETETMMNSVERVLFTSQEAPQEPPHHVSRPRHPYYHQLAGLTGAALPVSPREDTKLATCPDDRLLLTTGWPWEGRIEFRDGVTMRYRADTDLILKGVTLTIRPGEKIGIVGRTGSGKSSLMQVLFRMVDCEEGSIAVDGVDTKAIGLAALRSRLTIIPQDPVLFSGALRENLDPFNAYTDEEVWDALEQASLGPTVRGYPDGLHETVSEYGESLSAGQKQLVCLARALLRKTRVLLLDEATSSVDYETDRVIQSTLRSAFRDCTVLTIAHRLNTIMDSDRILVMEDGRVAEIDSPSSLLKDTNSHFSRLLSSERRQSPEIDVSNALDEDHDENLVGVGVEGDREGAHADADVDSDEGCNS